MMVANSFDLWRRDAFFSAAEEVQESADVMESVCRMWIKERQRGLTPQESTDLCREVQITLGTTKWQLEEFEKAIRLSHGHRSDESTASRHKQFIAAIESQIFRVETDLRESFVQEGKQPLRWVNLDERECDDLALFLSGPSLSLQTAKHNTHLENHQYGRDNDANLRTACKVVTHDTRSCKDTTSGAESECVIELNDRASSGNKEDIIYQQTATTNTRKTWSSPNFGALKVVVADECGQTSEAVEGNEATPKEKGSKAFFWRQKSREHPNGKRSIGLFSQVGGLKGQLQIPGHMQISCSVQLTLALMITMFLIVPIVLYSN